MATEEDVTRALAVCKKPFVAGNVEAFRRALIAINGLAQIPRLLPVLASSTVQEELLIAMKKFIEGRDDVFSRASLIQCCLKAMTNVVLNIGNASACETVVTRLLDYGQTASLKTMVDEQAKSSGGRADSCNSLVDLLTCVCQIGEGDKLQQLSDSGALINTTAKIMRSFPDNRRIQPACLNVLTLLATSQDGTAKLFSTGSLKLVVQYMQRTIVHEDVQTAGLRLWNATLKAGPVQDSADALQKAGAVEVLQNLIRVHPNSSLIKAELPSIHSALISHGTVEGELNAAVKALTQATSVSSACSLRILSLPKFDF